MANKGEVAALAAKINKQADYELVVLGSDLVWDELPKITTGSLALDYALGGGWPANQWSEVIGDPSQGKTATVLKTVAANQAHDPEFFTVWVAAEEYVKDWAEALGVDNSRVLVVDTNVMEDAYDAVVECLRSKIVDLVVIDSLPALVPVSEDVNEVGDSFPAVGARLTNKFFRKARSAMKRSLTEVERPVTGIVINQWREKIGVMHGDPRTTPGGKGKDFAFFVRVEMRRNDWITKGKDRVGQEQKMRVFKNKAARPQTSGVVDFYFDDTADFDKGQYDSVKDVSSVALATGVIEGRGAYFYYGEEKWQGRERMVNALRDDNELMAEISAKVLDTLNSVEVPDAMPDVSEPKPARPAAKKAAAQKAAAKPAEEVTDRRKIMKRSRAQERRTAQAFGATQHAGSGSFWLKKNDSSTDLLHIENKGRGSASAKQITIKLADLIDVERNAALAGAKIPVLSFEIGDRDFCIIPQADLSALVEDRGAEES
jgi:recombination protein RecA